MKKKYIYSIFLLGILIISCSSSSKLNQSNVKPEEIKELLVFETVSNIKLLNDNGKSPNSNDNYSGKSKAVLSKAMKSFNEKIPIKCEINIYEQNIKNRISEEISELFSLANDLQSTSTITIPHILDSVLEANSKRFGLLTHTFGITSIKANNSNVKKKEISSSGIFDVNDNSNRTQSLVSVIIIDSKENNIAFYKKSILVNEEPLDLIILKKQINEIFDGYFW